MAEKKPEEKKAGEPSLQRRILSLSPFFDNSCGVGSMAQLLVDELGARGNIVDRLEYKPWVKDTPYRYFLKDKEFRFQNSRELVAFLEKNSITYDVLHFHNQVFANGYNENLFRYFKDTPKLTQVHCVIPYDQKVLGKLSPHNQEELQRQVRMLNKVDAVVHLTDEVDGIAKKLYGVEHPENTFVIPNSARRPELNELEVAKLRKKLAPEDQRLFLYVGRLAEEKGIFELAEAFKNAKQHNENIKLIICGDNKSRPEAKDRIRQKLGNLQEGIDYVLQGQVSPNSLKNFYAASDFFIQPSKYEHFSVAAIDAFSHGKPVITTKMDSIVDTFKLNSKDRLAIPIEKCTAGEIEKSISASLALDKESLQGIVDRASKFYETNLTPDKVISRFETLYDTLIRSKKAGPRTDHTYVIPVTKGEKGLEKTVDSALEQMGEDDNIVVSSYGGHKPTAHFFTKYQSHLESGKLRFLASEEKITKHKSNALNKAISESNKTGSRYISILLPGYEVNESHIAQLGRFDKKTLMVHGHAIDDEPGYTSLEKALKKANPIHQSTVTMKADLADQVGMFYDSLGYAEDMDYYQKIAKHLGEGVVKDVKAKVLR